MSSEKEVLVPLVYARCDKPHLDLIKIVPGTGNAEPLPWLDTSTVSIGFIQPNNNRLSIILTILEPNFPLLPPAPQLRLCQLSSTPHGSKSCFYGAEHWQCPLRQRLRFPFWPVPYVLFGRCNAYPPVFGRFEFTEASTLAICICKYL